MFTLNCKGRLLVVNKPLVMGILNATPDSFFAQSRIQQHTLVEQAAQMIGDGAAILDIGGQSTRPGSERVTATEETARVCSAIETVRTHFPGIFISVDTYYASVARAAIAAGADIVNDISAGNLDQDMMATVAGLQVPYICMHMQGMPENMQQNPVYNDVTREVLDFFIGKVAECRQAGINDVVIDPGFGFGKNVQHNFTLLKNLSAFAMLDKPILAGLSRKSLINKALNIKAADALNGTTVVNTMALLNGAHLLRVHDVKEAVETVTLVQQFRS